MKRRDVLKYTAYATGFAVSGSLASALLSGCKAEPAEPDYTPVFLSEDEYLTIADVSEAMLPATDTPGAKDVGVPQFIDFILKGYTEEKDQTRFKSGIRQFIADAQAEHGKAFTELGADQQLQHINKVDAAAKVEAEAIEEMDLTAEEKGDRFPFFITLKGMVIGAYFSSEKVGTEVLAYDPIPGDYLACMPLSDNGGVNWSL